MNSEATTAGAPQAKPATAPPPQAVFQINCRHCGARPSLSGADVAFEWRRLPMSELYRRTAKIALAVAEHCVCIFRCPVCGNKGQNRVEAMQGMT